MPSVRQPSGKLPVALTEATTAGRPCFWNASNAALKPSPYTWLGSVLIWYAKKLVRRSSHVPCSDNPDHAVSPLMPQHPSAPLLCYVMQTRVLPLLSRAA